MTGTSVQSHRTLLPAFLAAAGLVLLQTLIGGRRLLFCFPGLILIAAAALIAVATLASPKARVDFRCLASAGIFCGYILLRSLFSPGYFARPDLFSVIGVLLVYGLTTIALSSSGARLVIVCSLLAFAVVHVLIGIVQFTGGNNFMLISFLQRVDYGPRASGFYVCPNHLAGLLEVVGIFGVSLVCWSRWPIWGKMVAAYASAATYVGLVLTGSRGGYLSAIASLVVFAGVSLFVVRSVRPGRWLKLGAFALAALAAVGVTTAVLIQQNGYLSDRAGRIIDTKNMRVQLWEAALRQWELQPVVGTGAGTYRFFGRQFRNERMQNDPVDVHNDYLHLLCEYGILGFAGFLYFFSVHVRQGWQTLRQLTWRAASRDATLLSNRLALSLGALSAVSAYVVHSMVDFNLHIPANAMLLAFVFGLLANPGFSHGSAAPRPTSTRLPRIAMASLATILLVQCGRYFPGEYYGERARAALRDEDPAAAILLGQKALSYETRNPEVFFYLGRALLARAHHSEGNGESNAFYEQAIAAFAKAYQLAPLDGTYPLNLAFTYDEAGRFEEAERMYEVARARDPLSMTVAQLYKAHRESREKLGGAQPGQAL